MLPTKVETARGRLSSSFLPPAKLMNLFCSVYYLLPYDVALRAPSYFPFDRRICQVTGRAAKERAQSAPSLPRSVASRMLNADYGVAVVDGGKGQKMVAGKTSSDGMK